MDIIVCMKQVVDLQQIRIKRDTREPVLEGLPYMFGAFEKNALEEAVRLKEKHSAKVIALGVGTAKLKDTIIEALAMGADEAVILTDPAFEGSDTIGSAKVIAKALQKLGAYDLILMGEGSADNYSGQIISRVAELLGLPQVTYVRELSIDNKRLRAVRDMEDALEVVEVDCPAVLSVTSEINTPRLPSLAQILKASRKPTTQWKAADIGIASDEVGAKASTVSVLSNLAPEQARKNVLFEGNVDEVVDELTKALQKEGMVR
jgi:electron transfer flavoprotein beta subunit